MRLAIKRFDFEGLQDFAAPLMPMEVANDHTLPEAEEFAPPPPPSFSEEELNVAKKAAFEDGRRAGVEEENSRQDRETKARDDHMERALQSLAMQAGKLLPEYQQFKELQTRELAALVKMMVKKVAGDIIEADPSASIEQLIDECIGIMQTQPKLIVTVNRDIAEDIDAKLKTVVHQHHLETMISLRTSTELGAGEARLEWQDGSAERDMDTIWQQIEDRIGQVNFALLATNPTTNHQQGEQA